MSRPSPHTNIVYRAVRDLSDEESIARRESLKKRTGLPFSIIDEAIKRLREDEGSVYRLKSGAFVPIEKYEEEAISATVMIDGHVKIEVGDQLMTLTPRGCAKMMGLLVGAAMMPY